MIDFCNLSKLRSVEVETTFSVFETVAEVKSSFVLNVDSSGTEVMSFSGIFLLPEAEVVSIEQIAVLVVLGGKKNVASNRCRALQS